MHTIHTTSLCLWVLALLLAHPAVAGELHLPAGEQMDHQQLISADQEETGLSHDEADSVTIARFDSLVRVLLPKGANVALMAYDLSDRRTLYAYQADKLGRPASNMKLLTTIAALDRDQADEPFRTEVWAEHTPKNREAAPAENSQQVAPQDTLYGNLYVVGGMDPEFDEAALDSLVSQVTQQPFKVICGTIYGDVSLRDSLPYGNGWCWDDIPYDYQPWLSPLMLCKGVLQVKATPSATKGEPATLTFSPASSYYTVENLTCSRTPQAGDFHVERNWMEQSNHLKVSGNVHRTRSSNLTLHGSAQFFMHTFVERLLQRGIALIDAQDSLPTHKPIYAWKRLENDAAATCIAHYETPMQQVVKQIMKESDNLNTEAVLTRLGAQTTDRRPIHAEDGLQAVRQLIQRLGLNPKDYNLADGCGLSNYNAISPELLVAFLRHAYSRTELFQKLYKALPVAGIDGTLKNRMKKGSPAYGNVHAKTGTISGISSLSGYLQGRSGHWIAFSIMNQNQLSGRDARRMQDILCEQMILAF